MATNSWKEEEEEAGMLLEGKRGSVRPIPICQINKATEMIIDREREREREREEWC
jgi:hypothetical protein